MMLDGAIMGDYQVVFDERCRLETAHCLVLAIHFATACSHHDLPPRKWDPNHMWVYMCVYIYITRIYLVSYLFFFLLIHLLIHL